MLKKISFLALVVFFSFILIHSSSTRAQESMVKVKSPAIELSVDHIYIPCEDPSNPACTDYPVGQSHPDPANADHELGLTSGGLPPNTEIYIVGCINTNTGTHCTTGSNELNQLLNSMVGGDSMNPDPSHHFKVLNNPVKTDLNGNLNVTVRTFTPQVTTHFFNGYFIEDQNLQPTTIANQPLTPPEQALHLQNFAKSTPVPKITIRPKKPAIKFTDQDPKGRLFDIKSLEPVVSIEVSLLNSLKNLFSYKSIINPQIVQLNGEFNFWVPNGIYYLSFAKIPTTHSWPVEMSNVHPNYSLAYYCDKDVKDDKNSSVPLYFNQFSIIEYNKLVHCDVPLDPGNNPPIRTMVKTIDYGLTRSTSDNSLNYTGKVTHPFTKVQLMAVESGRVVTEVEADKLGFWKVNLLSGSYPLTKEGLPDKIILKYIKKDLTLKETFKPIEALSFEPLLNYIEGYSYDKNNKIIPNARVGIKQKNSDSIVFVTKSDESGYFRIGSKYLPTLAYDLVFRDDSVNQTFVISTSQFVDTNKDYLTSKKLDLLSSENEENTELNAPSIGSFRNLKTGQDQFENNSIKEQENPVVSKNNSMLNIFFALLLIVIVVGIGLFQFIKSKKANPPVSL